LDQLFHSLLLISVSHFWSVGLKLKHCTHLLFTVYLLELSLL